MAKNKKRKRVNVASDKIYDTNLILSNRWEILIQVNEQHKNKNKDYLFIFWRKVKHDL